MVSTSLSVSVVICAYTADRWECLDRAVTSVLAQSIMPAEIIVCVDHNEDLLNRCRLRWPSGGDHDPPVHVIENLYPGRLGSARNTALQAATGEIIAFLDDDASVEDGWIARIVITYQEVPEAKAVGGAPRPLYEAERPTWIPFEFDWVFGCAYRGLPPTRTAARRLIGACMTVRRKALLEVGGFHSDDHDDMDLSHRIAHQFGLASVVYEPKLGVWHYVTAERLTWRYFYRRCFLVNVGKVLTFRDMAAAGNLEADLAFVRQTLLRGVPEYLRQRSAARATAAVVGIGLAGLGNIYGRLLLRLGQVEPSLTRGLEDCSAGAAAGTPAGRTT